MVDRRTDDSGNRWHAERRRIDAPAPVDGKSGVDDLLATLSHRRRREILYYLSDHGLATTQDIATVIATRENGPDSDGSLPERRATVCIDLTHNHLPKLSDRGLIEYDRRSGAVRWSEPSASLESLLECCRSLDDDHSESRS